MDAPLKEGDTSTLYDVVNATELPRPDVRLMEDLLNTEVNRALNMLSDKAAKIIRPYINK